MNLNVCGWRHPEDVASTILLTHLLSSYIRFPPTLARTSLKPWQLNHLSISRLHAAMVHGPQKKVYILDLGSTNGTFVNDRRLKPFQRELVTLDTIIQFGGSTRSYNIAHYEGLLAPGCIGSAGRPSSPFSRVRKRSRRDEGPETPRSRPSTAESSMLTARSQTSETSLATARSQGSERPSSGASSKQSLDLRSPSPSPRLSGTFPSPRSPSASRYSRK